jgi:hypothetical protein
MTRDIEYIDSIEISVKYFYIREVVKTQKLGNEHLFN